MNNLKPIQPSGDIQPKLLKDITFKQFKEFLDSLDEEKKTWSLDLQNNKNRKEFYEVKKDLYMTIVCVDGEKVIGLCDYYENLELPILLSEISFVVKKGYQGQGIGTKMLLTIETLMKDFDHKYVTAKHYKDNIASHKAFLKVGYEEWVVGKKYYFDSIWFDRKLVEGDDWEWKIKEL
mgnify:CR=1 FL=1